MKPQVQLSVEEFRQVMGGKSIDAILEARGHDIPQTTNNTTKKKKIQPDTPQTFSQTISIIPLSVNQAWKGRRFKTKLYTKYEKELLLKLKPTKLPKPPYKVDFVFGFSNKASDLDNPIKCLLDILQKKYKFNDKLIYELNIKKLIVPKSKEFIDINIKTLIL